MDADDTVGFIGLGMMGLHMASNVLRAGFPLVVRDLDPERSAALENQGAIVAASPAELARSARIIVLMVDTTAQVEAVLFGEEGIAPVARPGTRILCMSTIDPDAARDFARRLDASGVGLVDAPVSGMEKGARAGTLKAFVGGSEADLAVCRPVLDSMASQVVHVGGVGQGLAMKLVNNLLIQVGWVVIAEALVLGRKAGLDPEQMVELIGDASGNSVAFQYMAPRWLERDFEGIRLDITFKDLQHQVELGKSLGVPMFLANLAQQVYQLARCRGLGSEDGVAVVKVYEEMAGVSPGSGRD